VSELTKKVKNSGQSVNVDQQARFPMRASDSSMGGEADQFHTTCWTLVMASAHDQSQAGCAALANLYQTYWYPLYAFARRRGHSPPDAQDLTQGFFLHVTTLRQDYVARKKASFFDTLKTFVGIGESTPETSYEEAAKALDVGVGTVKTLIRRLRKQYLAVVREEVSRTVSDPAEVEGEIRALCDALIAAEGRLKP
jgi:hypothetical protein